MNNIDLSELKRWAYRVCSNFSNAGKQSNSLPIDDSPWPIIEKVHAMVLNDDGVDVEDKKMLIEAVLNKWSAVFLSSMDSTVSPESRKKRITMENDFKKNWSSILEDEFYQELEQFMSFDPPTTKSASSAHKM